MSLQSDASCFMYHHETPCLIRRFQQFKESDIGIYLQCRAKSEYELPSTATSIFSDVMLVGSTASVHVQRIEDEHALSLSPSLHLTRRNECLK